MATSDNTPVFPAFPAFPSSQPLTRRERFNELCPDPSGRINAIQLLQDLKNMDSTDFRLETAGMLIRWYDTDKSGTIDFEEYDKIIGFVEDWKKKFNEADADKSGRIDNLEIKDALDKMGYEVKQEFVDAVMKQQAVK
ncbi:EF-hand, partial [Ramicandelaber brevisporus]